MLKGALGVLEFGMLTALTIALYVVPSGASPWIIWPALILFYSYFLIALLRPVRIHPTIPTYVSIEVLFLMFYYLVFFMQYQLDVLNMTNLYQSIFLTYTYVSQSNLSVVAATIGFVAFCLGMRLQASSSRAQVAYRGDRGGGGWYRYRRLSPVVFVLLAGLSLIYEIAGWHSADEGRYTGITSGGAVADGVYHLIVMLCMISIARAVAMMAQRRLFEVSLWLSLGLTSYWAIRILLNGDRNSFFLLAIVAGGGVFTYCFRVGRLFLFGCVVSGLMLYQGVEISRMAKDRSLDALVEATFTKGLDKNPSNSSFIVSTTTLRASFDIVPEREGYGYGKYKVLGLIGVVPFIRGVILGDSRAFRSTAEVITFYVLGLDASWGLGSNIISDIYIDFGFIGIPIMMLLLGMSAGSIQRAAVQRPDSTKMITMYLLAFALIAEMPRYSFDFPIRMLVWTFLLFWLYDKLMIAHRSGAINHGRFK